MDRDQLVRYLEEPQAAKDWLRSLGIRDYHRAHGTLVSLSNQGLTIELLAVIGAQLTEHLAGHPQSDAVLDQLARFISASRNPLAFGALLERDPAALPTLIQVLSTSPSLADQIISDPESFDLLRLTDGQAVERLTLINEITSELQTVHDDDVLAFARLERFRNREKARIVYGQLVGNLSLPTVIQQNAYLADALCEAALRYSWLQLEGQRGRPLRATGAPARCALISFGKLGGEELGYSDPVEILFLCDGDGKSEGTKPLETSEWFEKLARNFVSLIGGNPNNTVPLLRLQLQQTGQNKRRAHSLEASLHHYDIAGRTWERQAYIKARVSAGDHVLGNELLDELQPWVFRRYLNRADITGIRALKRRLVQRLERPADANPDLQASPGGSQDLESVVQFLQLLNGGTFATLRVRNTLQAIDQLEAAKCLTQDETSCLRENYRLLRAVEHHLQILFDRDSCSLPDCKADLERLVAALTPALPLAQAGTSALKKQLLQLLAENRTTLQHLLDEAFEEEQDSAIEYDLVLDPKPDAEAIAATLSPYGFQDAQRACARLLDLSTERIPFLSTRRCRHFLAAIANPLLSAIADTPNPDQTLENLCHVSDSLGGKGVLWELFNFHPASLRLYVRLCASSWYLSRILTKQPGMIDELLDSLLVDRLPSMESLEHTLAELCQGASDIEPMLHSFKDGYHLRVGVRDLLRKESVKDTHRALSDIAEVCLGQITERQYYRLTERHGEPTVLGKSNEGQICELVVLAMGKLGGQEPNFHSDLDLVFLYEADGQSIHRGRLRRDKTTNQRFFSLLGQRIIKAVTQRGPYGRLYELNTRLRLTGSQGALAVSFADFSQYFGSGKATIAERQAICKARPIYGSTQARSAAANLVRQTILEAAWQPAHAEEIRQHRQRLEASADQQNLKRSPGGTMDIEFVVQMLQLRYASEFPHVLAPGTLDALEKLREANLLDAQDASYFDESYRFLRRVESGLRLMDASARHDLPKKQFDLYCLADLLGVDSPVELKQQFDFYTHENRLRFNRLFDDTRG